MLKFRPYFQMRLVTRRLWVEVAAWWRHLQPVRLEKTKCWPVGWRVFTPVTNAAFCIDWRKV